MSLRSRTALATVLLLAAAAPAARAADPAPIHPVWTQRPTAEDVAAAYPAKAKAEGVGGRAVVDCAVADTGALTGCVILSEDPPGQGFGDAAMSLTPKMRLDPKGGGRTLGQRLSLPVRFTPPPPPREVVFHAAKPGFEHAGAAGPYYPQAALHAGVAGEAVIECKPAGDGVLKACGLVSEKPADQGFGAAALSLAKAKAITAAPRPDGQAAPPAGQPERFRVPFTPAG